MAKNKFLFKRKVPSTSTSSLGLMAIPYTTVSVSVPPPSVVALWMICGGVAAAVLIKLINCNDDEDGVSFNFCIHDVYVVDAEAR